MILNTDRENVNGSNAHEPDLLSSNQGAPKGITVGKNKNIASWPERSNPQPRIIQAGGARRRSRRRRRRSSKRRSSKRRSSRRRRSNRGGRKRRRSRRNRRSRRRRRRRQRGGGVYGFSPEELPNFGKRSINWAKRSNGCGVASKSNLGAGQQYATLPQRGGGIDTKGSGLAGIGNAQSIAYGYNSKVSELAKELRGGYAPISRTLRPQCAGRRRRRKSRKRRRRRRRQRGGYHQYQSNKPLTSSYQVGGVDGDWKLANPPPIGRKNNCRDNYNHYKGEGSASPVLDQAAVY